MPSSSSPQPRLRIGTRGSPLALAQAEETCARLRLTQPALAEPAAIQVVVIKTSGDRILDRPLAGVGGKGLFTKEIDEALLAGRVDLAVHSAKDLPTWLPEPIMLAATLTREDPRDALIARSARTIAELPEGCIVGTSSLRRQAQLLHHRPDLAVVPLRGNVASRLRKVADGSLGATFLAMAGLNRLSARGGLADCGVPRVPVATGVMLPAVGQAAIAVTCRKDDEAVRMLLAAIDDEPTHLCVAAERAMLERLDGSCRTPIAGLAAIGAADGTLSLSGLIARPDGSAVVAGTRSGASAEGPELGRDLAAELLAEAGPGFLDQA